MYVSYCQLHGESNSVGLNAIEPGLVAIRKLASEFTSDNIYNCDETRMKELNSKSYTVGGNDAGGKPGRAARVSLLVCVNASGLSIRKAETMSSLRPLLLGNDGRVKCLSSIFFISKKKLQRTLRKKH